MKNEVTKVVFRRFPKKDGGDVIAIFPQEPGTSDPCTCQSYMRVGQHGSCDPYGLVSRTKPVGVFDEDVKDLIRELENYGPPEAHYKLDIQKKITQYDYEFRKKAVPVRDASYRVLHRVN